MTRRRLRERGFTPLPETSDHLNNDNLSRDRGDRCKRSSLLPLIESFGIATAAEVDVETLGERLQREADSSGRLIVLPPHVTAYTRLPT